MHFENLLLKSRFTPSNFFYGTFVLSAFLQITFYFIDWLADNSILLVVISSHSIFFVSAVLQNVLIWVLDA